MSPGSKYDDGFGSPIDDDDFHDEDRNSPSPEEDSSQGDSEQYIKDGNDFILKQLKAKNISRQYSNSQAAKSNNKTAMTLDGVDWSGFSGKVHKKELKPGSSKRLHTAKNDEILEVKGKSNSSDGRDSSRSSRRRLSPGKFQSRRASAKKLLNLSEDLSASLHDLKAERRSRASSSRERKPRQSSRSRQAAGDSSGGSSHARSSRRSRRNLRTRAHSEDLKTGEITEDGPLDSGTGSGHRPRRNHSRRSNTADAEGLVDPSRRTRSPGNRIARSERGLATRGPRRQSSLVSYKSVSNEDAERKPGSPRSPGTRKPRAERERPQPKKHSSTGVIAVRSSRRADKNSRSISPGPGGSGRPSRNPQSPGRGLAAASATTLEVGRPKAPRTRRASKDGGPRLIKSKGSVEW